MAAKVVGLARYIGCAPAAGYLELLLLLSRTAHHVIAVNRSAHAARACCFRLPELSFAVSDGAVMGAIAPTIVIAARRRRACGIVCVGNARVPIELIVGVSCRNAPRIGASEQVAVRIISVGYGPLTVGIGRIAQRIVEIV